MYIKRKDVLEAVKGYFHGLIDAGTKDVDVVDCGVELQRVIGSVDGITEDTVKVVTDVSHPTPHPSPAVTPSPQGEGFQGRWVSVKDALPPEGEVVLVIVDGKYGNIEFIDAIELGSYYPEGWLLEGYHKIDNPRVSYWMELPDGPENGEG